jgi:hypothetical protein
LIITNFQSRLREQGYDGASNMRGEINGFQRKIVDENPYTLYVHCFAHPLQLVVVSIATSSCSYIHDFLVCITYCKHNKFIMHENGSIVGRTSQKIFWISLREVKFLQEGV